MKKIIKDWLSGKINYNINKKINTPWFQLQFSIRSKNNFMGRFGGGWNWKLGFQIGGKTIIISLLIAELSFRPHSYYICKDWGKCDSFSACRKLNYDDTAGCGEGNWQRVTKKEYKDII